MLAVAVTGREGPQAALAHPEHGRVAHHLSVAVAERHVADLAGLEVAEVLYVTTSEQRLVVLQRAQAGRVRRADVERDVIGERREQPEGEEVIGGRFLQRRDARFAEIDADRDRRRPRARAQPAQALGDHFCAVVVEPEPVDQRLLARVTKDARPRISRLRLRRDGADLDEAEPERFPSRDRDAVFIETGGEPDRIAKVKRRKTCAAAARARSAAERPARPAVRSARKREMVRAFPDRARRAAAARSSRKRHSLGRSFPDAKSGEERVENIFHVGVPDDFADGVERRAQIDRDKFRREIFQRARRARDRNAPSARRRQSRCRALIATALGASQRCRLTFAKICSSRPASPFSVVQEIRKRIAAFPIRMLGQIALVQQQQLRRRVFLFRPRKFIRFSARSRRPRAKSDPPAPAISPSAPCLPARSHPRSRAAPRYRSGARRRRAD